MLTLQCSPVPPRRWTQRSALQPLLTGVWSFRIRSVEGCPCSCVPNSQSKITRLPTPSQQQPNSITRLTFVEKSTQLPGHDEQNRGSTTPQHQVITREKSVKSDEKPRDVGTPPRRQSRYFRGLIVRATNPAPRGRERHPQSPRRDRPVDAQRSERRSPCR
jgi:hypothetical protein